MAIASIEYWQDAARARESSYQKRSTKALRKIQRAYDRAFDNIEKQLKSAEKQLEKKGSDTAEDAAAYHSRMQRMQSLQKRVYEECRKIAPIEKRVSETRYSEVIKEGYYQHLFDIQKGIGIGFDFSKLPEKVIDEVLSTKWAGRIFSKSIWKNTKKLSELTEEVLSSGFLSGATVQTMAAQIEDVMHAGKIAAERLIRTETNYFSNQGELLSYHEAGIERYQYLATLDNRTSEDCQDLDNIDFPVSDALVGKNYPPMHPWCRSTTVAFFDDQNLEKIERRARDPTTGKTMLIPADMNYNEWYSKYVV